MGWPEKMAANALNDAAPLLRELDEENNELAARERLASSRYDVWQSRVVEEWLRRKSDDRQAEAAARAEAREIETLKIASRAERWAMYSAIAAVIALIISIARSDG